MTAEGFKGKEDGRKDHSCSRPPPSAGKVVSFFSLEEKRRLRKNKKKRSLFNQVKKERPGREATVRWGAHLTQHLNISSAILLKCLQPNSAVTLKAEHIQPKAKRD